MTIALAYILLLLICIRYFPFFNDQYINKTVFSIAFLLKVCMGFVLTYIYTNYYPDRSTADIYKYYDDAKVMAGAAYHHPLDYLKMLSGIGNDNAYFDEQYYSKMNHWCRRYDFGTYNDNHTIIRFNALLMLVSFGSFHVHTLVMCFISFLGLTALYKSFTGFFPSKKNLVFAAVFLVPSVLFWGSGVLKEGILLFATGFIVYTFVKIVIEKKITTVYVLLFLSALLLQLVNKNYLLLTICPPLLCFGLVHCFKIKKVIFFYCAFLLLLFGTAYIVLKTMNKDPLQSIVSKRRDFVNLTRGGTFMLNQDLLIRIEPGKKEFLDTLDTKHFRIKPGSSYMYWRLDNFNDTLTSTNSTDTSAYELVWDLPLAGSGIAVSPLQPNLVSFTAHIPEALYISFLQPTLAVADSLPEKAAAIENCVLLLLLTLSFIFADFKNTDKNWLMLCAAVVLILYLIIGFTTPVAGAIVRYKIPALPFLMMIAINVIDTKRLRKIPLIKNLL